MKLFFNFILILFCSLACSQKKSAVLDEKVKNVSKSDFESIQNDVSKKRFKNEWIQADVYVKYAKLLKQRQDIDSSLVYFIKAEKIYNKKNHRDSLVYINTAIAEAFRHLIYSKESFRYIKIAESFIQLTTISKDILGYYYNRRAAIENMFGSKKNALEFSKKVIEIENFIKDKEIVVYSYNEIASLKELVFEKNKPSTFIRDYERALTLAKVYKLKIPQIDILINIGRAEGRVNNFDKEIEYYQKGLKIANEINSSYHKYNLHFNLITPYKKKNNSKKAYYHLMEAFKLKEILNTRNTASAIKEIENDFFIDKKEQELRIKNIEIVNNRNKFWLFFILFLFAIFGSSVLFYYFRKTKINNKKLEKLSQENEFLLQEANHRINNNLQLIIILIADELKKIDTQYTKDIRILPKIESIATLHKHLYKKNDIKKIDLAEYIKEIKLNFHELFEKENVKVKLEIENKMIPTDDAMYLGLLITELFINSIKHAFLVQTNKKIHLSCNFTQSELHFSYYDNGSKNVNKIVDPKLINKLCKQINVFYSIDTAKGFQFEFKKKGYE